MQPPETADSTMNFGDPVVLGILAVFALTVLIGVIRWAWLLIFGIRKRRLTRMEWCELAGLSISLTALTFVTGYGFFVFWEASAWSEREKVPEREKVSGAEWHWALLAMDLRSGAVEWGDGPTAQLSPGYHAEQDPFSGPDEMLASKSARVGPDVADAYRMP